ncbi:uncharacterized protein [Magallana gigas]|uniref:uncharacterized protein isoform X4 n=1 Tax=Magallana gigas TaxID=29159 RepID=UPI003341AB54
MPRLYRYINATTAKETWWNAFHEQMLGNVPPLPPRKKHHVFFAHTSSDTKWVNDIVKRLENPVNSIVCCFPARDFKPGASMQESVDSAIKRSLRVVLVISKNFLANEWKKYFEKRFKQFKTIPIIISDCNLPIVLDDIVCIDARNSGTDWFKVLLRAIKEEDLNADDDTVTSTSQFIREEVIFTPAAEPMASLSTTSFI